MLSDSFVIGACEEKSVVYRVAYFSKFIRNETGTARSLVDTVTHLDRLQFTPVCFLTQESPLSRELERLKIEVLFCGQVVLEKKAIRSFFKQVCQYIIMFRKKKIDLIHAQEAAFRRSYVLAAKLLSIPIIIHLRNPYQRKAKSLNMLSDFTPFLAHRIISNSISNSIPFSEDPRFKKKTKVIYNGININEFSAAIANRKEFIGAENDTVLVGTVAQVCVRKGINDFIQMIPRIIKEIQKVHFIIVGSDAAKEPGYTEKMKGLAISLGVKEYVTFTGFRADIPSIMKALDIFVLASHAEPFGRVVVEAMAAGCPVIATRVGGIPEIITDENLGLLVKKEDPLALSQAVIRLILDENLRTAVGHKGQKHAQQDFSLELMIDALQNIYLSLLDPHSLSDCPSHH